MNTSTECCSEQEIVTTNSLFTNSGKLYSKVNGVTSFITLGELISSTVSTIERNISPTSNGQTLFLNAFPTDEVFVSLLVGIPMVLDVDFELQNNTIVWISTIPLDTQDVLTIITTKNIE